MTNKEFTTFYFDVDDDGHWYMLPSNLREDFDAWMDIPFDYEEFDSYKFKQYRLDGGITDIDFIPVNKEDIPKIDRNKDV